LRGPIRSDRLRPRGRERHGLEERELRAHFERHADASFHAYLSTLGLPIGPGDVLIWSWSANAATGPPIAFDFHSHVGGYVEYVNVTADRANNSWNVPGSSDYMVYWTNPNTESENVTYAFRLIPPPVELWPLYLLLVAPLVMIGALIWYSRRKKRWSY